MDVRSGAATQLTFDGDEDHYPVWSADSREVVYVSWRGKDHALWRKSADGTGTARHVLDGTDALVATDVYRHTLIFQDRGEGEQRDLFTLDLDSGPPRPLLATPDDEAGARVSPDGAWIVYVSTPAKGSTPNRRVYVRPFPNTAAGGQRAISEGQGAAPSWSPSGDEILYAVNSGTFPLMAVPVNVTPTTLTPSAPRELFTLANRVVFTRTGATLGYGSEYEVLPGGNEFLAVAVANAPPSSAGDGDAASQPHVNVVLNWFEELKKLVPTE
jgi:Tol biopolymer transport system component